MQGKSKKAFKKNVEIEMESGKPQKQSLAIAFDVQRRNRKKMAFGGKAEATNEPSVPKAKPDDRRLNKEDYMGPNWAGGPDPKRVPQVAGPSKDEYMANHFAKGGAVNPSLQQAREDGEVCTHCEGTGRYGKASENTNAPSVPGRKPEDRTIPESEYMAGHFAHGGEIDEPNHASVAEAILAKRRFNNMYSDGGEVDIEPNAYEGPGTDMSFNENAIKKELYDDGQLSSQPRDSNLRSEELEDENDHIGKIRAKIKSKRGY